MNDSLRHIAVLAGGLSAEREISLATGKECADALERLGYRVSRVDVDDGFVPELCALRPDLVFNALHGAFGEDGNVQGVLEMLRIPYTHSGVLASALGMDKVKSRIMFEAGDIPIPEGFVAPRMEVARRHVMSPPYVVKPVSGGSSLGLFVVGEGMEPPRSIGASDWRFGDVVLVERFVHGRELTCAVMGDATLGVMEIMPVEGVYDYRAKYAGDGTSYTFPAVISSNIYHLVENLSLRAHEALGCRGVTRADFRYDDRPGGTGELVCLEVNTQPGMTPVSLVPKLAAHAGFSFMELVLWMVEDASCNR